MTLVFLPDRRSFLLWGDDCAPACLVSVAQRGTPDEAELVTPAKRARVAGTSLPLLDTAAALAVVPVHEVPRLAGSVAAWTLASKLALDLVGRERVVPTIVQHGGRLVARWGAALSSTEDAAQVGALARSMPPAAYAVPAPAGKRREVWAPEALLRAFLDAMVDAMVRAAHGESQLPGARSRGNKGRRKRGDDDFTPWEQRWQAALTSSDGTFEAEGFAERTVANDLGSWSEPALGARDRLRACFRLELPEADGDPFALRFLLQSPDDPSLLITAAEAWSTKGRSLAKLGRAFRDPQESLLQALGRAARVFAPLTAALSEPRPERLDLNPAAAWQFLSEGAQLLADAGFGVIVPAELTAAGQRRLRLRMRVTGGAKVAGAVSGAAGLGLDELLHFEWEAALGDQALTARELKLLAKHKAPLVRHRGQWVAIDPRELAELGRRLSERSGTIGAREAIVAALAGETRRGDTTVAVTVDGTFGELISRLRDGAGQEARPPNGFVGTLRPYQARGLAWLRTMGTLGLGACLADDMGLGKTIQLLAFLLHQESGARPRSAGPALLVAPTSVLGNWEREAARFAPGLSVVRHYGADRARKPEEISREAGTMVVTSYGLLRRDVDLLSAVPWSTIALDEAQNIKNSASATAKAARALPAQRRFALTGTPVENRLAELWSIFEFANPGLLGPLEQFRREFAVPIERYGNDEAAARLRQIASPFLLRRLKSDPAIIQDLPPKNEMKVVCTLTREQATLYQAVVDEEMRRIESADGIERRGRVLALLMFLKQICNHPAQYLSEPGPLARRSGKLDRTVEMLEEAIAEGDKALVFTQFREMGDRLVNHLGQRLGVEVVFLHGGTPRKTRDEMVRRFQEEPHGPGVFVLSVKAGGTGLNLTAANHVFHFDRWWNPAVEDQATDRAYRIGQNRSVQVHKLVCAGTVEEKIDRMLEQKRDLARRVIGAGEKWITELGNDELRDLFALSTDVAVDVDDEELEGDENSLQRRQPRRRRTRAVEVQP
ncbi:MAG: DEAD/DEAH box helicase [Myxococcales bacterium]|nr:DEAD/DEAH box helicase [Myxococcales bacterium]